MGTMNSAAHCRMLMSSPEALTDAVVPAEPPARLPGTVLLEPPLLFTPPVYAVVAALPTARPDAACSALIAARAAFAAVAPACAVAVPMPDDDGAAAMDAAAAMTGSVSADSVPYCDEAPCTGMLPGLWDIGLLGLLSMVVPKVYASAPGILDTCTDPLWTPAPMPILAFPATDPRAGSADVLVAAAITGGLAAAPMPLISERGWDDDEGCKGAVELVVE